METTTVSFTSHHKHYEVGDTITIGLDNGKQAVYKLIKIEDSEMTGDEATQEKK